MSDKCWPFYEHKFEVSFLVGKVFSPISRICSHRAVCNSPSVRGFAAYFNFKNVFDFKNPHRSPSHTNVRFIIFQLGVKSTPYVQDSTVA